jgi:hypothetical protein
MQELESRRGHRMLTYVHVTLESRCWRHLDESISAYEEVSSAFTCDVASEHKGMMGSGPD